MSNKKVNIYTLNGYKNYGNRLQLYALSKVLRKMGVDVSIYWPIRITEKIKIIIKSLPLLRIKFRKENQLRRITRRMMPHVSIRENRIAIVGSDQVWNPDYFKKEKYLLNPNAKEGIISYAASIGKSSLSNDEKELFKEALQNYSYISVRESSAKELLGSLTDKEIKTVLDPTLLLNKEDYLELEKRPKNIREDKKYILCYILGGREQMDVVADFAKKKGYEIILFSDRKESNYGVGEFLYLIHHAQLICTDSFHACVFSFIFERPFVAFRRTGKADYMYTRLQNLINTFQLKNREFNGKEITEENLRVDYDNAKKILKKEQEESLDFLRMALGTKDEK